MNKQNIVFNKKSNPLAAVINQQNSSPNPTSRKNEQPDPSSKLYTFCSSSNKHKMELTDENKENGNQRERKVSINNLKGKIYEPFEKKGTLTKGKQSNSGTGTKERKKLNNMSVTCIHTLQSAFDRKRQFR